MGDLDETAHSYKISADLIFSKKGDKTKAISYLLKAANMYGKKNRRRAIECLEDIYNHVRGGSSEFELDQYMRYLHQLARLFEELEETGRAADVYSELAKEHFKFKDQLKEEKNYTDLQVLKKFLAYLAKALILFESIEKYGSILKLARFYYKVFPTLEKNKSLHGELFFCYEPIINAADITGSRYFREYYAELERKLHEE
jgi:hypothetical protein